MKKEDFILFLQIVLIFLGMYGLLILAFAI